MGDSVMEDEYPEEDQRLAVCEGGWADRDKAGDEKMYKAIFNLEVKSTDEGARVVEAVGSDATLDRDQEILDPQGWDLKNFRKGGGPVLFAHNHWDLPVAKAKVRLHDDKLKFKIEFPPMETYGFADVVYKMVKFGALNSLSVGFIPKSWEYPEDKTTNVHRICTEMELLEVSFVSVPANPNAIVTSRSMMKALKFGVIDQPELDEFELMLKQALQKHKEHGDEEVLIDEENKEIVELICAECEEKLITVCEWCDEDVILDHFLNPPGSEEEKELEDTDSLYDVLLADLRRSKAKDESKKEELVDEVLSVLRGTEKPER